MTRSFVGALALVVCAALSSPPAAGAHIRTSAVAVDERAEVFPPGPDVRAALTATVYPGDQALGVAARPGHTVVVLGYSGEPLLRIDDAGTAVNASSPTAEATGLVRPSEVSGRLAPLWLRRSRRARAVWHDGRVRALASGTRRRKWSVPLVVDGRLRRLRGEVWRVRAPSPWPWLVAGLSSLGLTAFLLAARRLTARPVAAGVGVVSAAGAVAVAIAFAAQPSASPGSWLEGAGEVVLALAGLFAVARGSADVRPVAGGALGLVGLSTGSTKFPVFIHGVVLAALPATLTRMLVLATMSAGAAAAAAGLIVFFELADRPEPALAPAPRRPA